MLRSAVTPYPESHSLESIFPVTSFPPNTSRGAGPRLRALHRTILNSARIRVRLFKV